MIQLAVSEYTRILPYISSEENNGRFIFVFVYSVIEQLQLGGIYVNDRQAPTAGLVVSRGGKYYVFGTLADQNFNQSLVEFLLDERNHCQFYDLYASSSSWMTYLSAALKEQVVPLSRTHYTYMEGAIPNASVDLEYNLALTDIDSYIYNKYQQEVDASYKQLWNSAEDYLHTAFGYCFMANDQIVSTCHTFYIGGGYIEPDIRTHSDYRQRGYALRLCQHFIKTSVERGLIPYWDCDAGNQASNALALRLGLSRVGDVPILWWHEDKEIIQRYLIKYGYI